MTPPPTISTSECRDMQLLYARRQDAKANGRAPWNRVPAKGGSFERLPPTPTSETTSARRWFPTGGNWGKRRQRRSPVRRGKSSTQWERSSRRVAGGNKIDDSNNQSRAGRRVGPVPHKQGVASW